MEVSELKGKSANELLKDIRLEISWSKISRRYFDKSVSWFYNKMRRVERGRFHARRKNTTAKRTSRLCRTNKKGGG